MGWILLFIHLICCVIVYILMRLHILKTKPYMLPLVIFVPVTGLLCCLMLHFQVQLKKSGNKKVGLSSLRIEEDLYRGMLRENSETDKKVIPLEEALIVNDSFTRRSLMMDILMDDPEQYMDMLLMARMNEDVEVVHYATTAMAELSKQYEKSIAQLERSWKNNPNDMELLEDYLALMKRYVEGCLVDGHMELAQREKYSELLRAKLVRDQDFRTILRYVENEMILGHMDEVCEMLSQMEAKWGEEQNYQMLCVEYYVRMGDGEGLKRQIQMMESQPMYISSENREKLKFWRAAYEEENT